MTFILLLTRGLSGRVYGDGSQSGPFGCSRPRILCFQLRHHPVRNFHSFFWIGAKPASAEASSFACTVEMAGERHV